MANTVKQTSQYTMIGVSHTCTLHCQIHLYRQSRVVHSWTSALTVSKSEFHAPHMPSTVSSGGTIHEEYN